MKLNLPNHLYRNGSLAGSEAGKLLQSWQRRFYYSPRRIGGKWVNKRLIVLLTIQRLAVLIAKFRLLHCQSEDEWGTLELLSLVQRRDQYI